MNQIGIGKSVTNIASLFSKKPTSFEFHKAIYDTLFTQNAVWMQNPDVLRKSVGSSNVFGNIANSAVTWLTSTPVPLLGFSFQTPKQFEILKYQYTETPFVSRQVIANNQFKLPTEITLQGIRPIQRTNALISSFLQNWVGIKNIIEAYADAGGLWTIFTGWGVRTDYVLVALNGNYVENDKNAGVGWEFKFKQYNFDSMTTSLSKETSSILKMLGN